MNYAIPNVALVTLLIVKLVKTHTDQEHTQSLDPLALKKKFHIQQTVQLENLQQEKHSKIQHVLLLTLIIPSVLKNVLTILKHAQKMAVKVLESVSMLEPER